MPEDTQDINSPLSPPMPDENKTVPPDLGVAQSSTNQDPPSTDTSLPSSDSNPPARIPDPPVQKPDPPTQSFSPSGEQDTIKTDPVASSSTTIDPIAPSVSPVVATTDNTSGQGSSAVVPEEVKGWSWGGFLLSWIWAVGNSVWIGLIALVPYVGFVMSIILGIKGREWAWQAKRYESVEQFKKTQHKWDMWSIVLALLIIPATIFIMILIVIVAINPVGRIKEADAAKVNSDVREVGTAISACIANQTAMGVSADQTYSKSAWDASTKKGGCADSATLIQGNYISLIPSGITITTGTSKICAYKATGNEPTLYASWDSNQRQVVTSPNGTTTCN